MSIWHKINSWWQGQWSEKAAQPRRYVLISDLHLGEDVGDGDAPLTKNIDASNKLISGFIKHLIDTAEKPFTLIINGDGIDFLRTVLQPNPVEARLIPASSLSPREARMGKDSSREHAVWKLGRVLGFHRPVFVALAEFIAAGHSIVMIRGNHDVELYWTEVREAITSSLADLAHIPEEELRSRLRFEPWFFYEPSCFYVEHGHQYDPHCSYMNLLDPVEDEGQSLALPYASWAIRYFAPLLHGAPAAEMEEWNLWQFFSYAIKQPPKIFITTVFGYLRLIADVSLRKSWRHTIGRPAIRKRHRRRLAAVAEHAGLPLYIVEKLDSLKREPVSERFWGIALAFYVDRFLLMALASLALIGIVALLPGSLAKVLAIGLVLGGSWLLNSTLQAIRSAEAQAPMQQRALRIARLLNVPFVSFGHSHYADIQGENRFDGEMAKHFYLNSGHWVASYPHSAGTFVEFINQADGSPQAQMFRWQAASASIEKIGEARPNQAYSFDADSLSDQNPHPKANKNIDKSASK